LEAEGRARLGGNIRVRGRSVPRTHEGREVGAAVKCIGCREREAIESEWNSSMCDDCLVAVKSARKKMEAGMSPPTWASRS